MSITAVAANFICDINWNQNGHSRLEDIRQTAREAEVAAVVEHAQSTSGSWAGPRRKCLKAMPDACRGNHWHPDGSIPRPVPTPGAEQTDSNRMSKGHSGPELTGQPGPMWLFFTVATGGSTAANPRQRSSCYSDVGLKCWPFEANSHNFSVHWISPVLWQRKSNNYDTGLKWFFVIKTVCCTHCIVTMNWTSRTACVHTGYYHYYWYEYYLVGWKGHPASNR